MSATTSYWVCRGCSDRLKQAVVCSDSICRRCTGVCELVPKGGWIPTKQQKQLRAIALRSLPVPTIRKVIQP